MIRYALKCPADHPFESWFANAEAFDSLKSAGMIACPSCGDTDVRKSLMSPGVQPARRKATSGPAPERSAEPADAPQVDPRLIALRKHVEANSDYVGLEFAAEARRMHDGDIPHRSIYGEAKLDEAKKLVEDGVPVAPLPFAPTRKTN